MKLFALLGAIVAGIIGAAVWAAISYYANMEVGYIAWGIGLLVGFAAHSLGGEGTGIGVVCGVIALASMLGGKGLAHNFAVEAALKDEVLPDTYEYMQADAAAFETIQTEEQIPQFMIDQQYSQAESADQVSPGEIEEFNSFNAEPLREFSKAQPTFDEWQKSDQAATVRNNIHQEYPIVDGIKDSLGPFDLIFGFLGISSAFKLAMNDQEDGDVATSQNYGPEYDDDGTGEV